MADSSKTTTEKPDDALSPEQLDSVDGGCADGHHMQVDIGSASSGGGGGKIHELGA
jgi:hypothetical protein